MSGSYSRPSTSFTTAWPQRIVLVSRVEGIGRRAVEVPALVQRRRHLVAEAGVVGAGEEAVESHCRASPAIMRSLGQQRFGLFEMQPLDHAAVERDHALAGILRQARKRRRSPAPRRSLRRRARTPRWPARSARDGSASCRRSPWRRPRGIRRRRRRASRKSLRRRPARRARRRARQARSASARARGSAGRACQDAGFLGEIVGAGDEAGQPRGADPGRVRRWRRD